MTARACGGGVQPISHRARTMAAAAQFRARKRRGDTRMHEIETAIEIEAGPREVWRVLTDFARYPEWNPFITRISGDLVDGGRLQVRIVPPGAGRMTFRPRVTRLSRE